MSIIDKLFGRKNPVDDYEFQRMQKGKLQGADLIEEKDSTDFGVLIHFTGHAEYVHVIKNDEVYDDNGLVCIESKTNSKLYISGSFVFINNLDSLEAVHSFLEKYRLANPIWIEHS